LKYQWTVIVNNVKDGLLSICLFRLVSLQETVVVLQDEMSCERDFTIVALRNSI